MDPKLPFTLADVERIEKDYPTPFYLYDERKLRRNAKNISIAMQKAGVKGFKNYFAVKALPNPAIISLLVDEGMGVDCSSLAELVIAEKLGLKGEDIMFTSNNTSNEEFIYASKLGAIINFDDISLVRSFLRDNKAPKIACCRYNPGDISFDTIHESIIGKPSEAKYGMTHSQIIDAYKILQAAGVKEFGLHTMLLSNEVDWQHHERIAAALFELAQELHEKLGIKLRFINLGGGIGVPYHPEEHVFEIEEFAKSLNELYKTNKFYELGSPDIVMENGRYITADAGYLVTKVNSIKRTHKTYIGLDASMSNLMRPGMYGAYHHITILGKESDDNIERVDVVGSLCENNDKFAINRMLPKVQVGDIAVLHTVGAHGHAMGFQYNGKLRCAELLQQEDGTIKLVRRAETLDDYFATLNTGAEDV
jgi:diaminopimelate decarboxylase